MSKSHAIAATILLAGVLSVSAKAETYLEGRFDLNMKETHFPGPEAPALTHHGLHPLEKAGVIFRD